MKANSISRPLTAAPPLRSGERAWEIWLFAVMFIGLFSLFARTLAGPESKAATEPARAIESVPNVDVLAR